MSKPKRLLGPDGRPLDRSKYLPAPPPAPEPVLVSTTTDEVHDWGKSFRDGLLSGMWGRGNPRPTRQKRTEPSPELVAAVEEQLAEIHDALPADWTGHEEVPAVPPELTDTYDVAFASAAKNCPHENSHGTTHSRRERQCTDCGRYFTRRSPWD